MENIMKTKKTGLGLTLSVLICALCLMLSGCAAPDTEPVAAVPTAAPSTPSPTASPRPSPRSPRSRNTTSP